MVKKSLPNLIRWHPYAHVVFGWKRMKTYRRYIMVSLFNNSEYVVDACFSFRMLSTSVWSLMGHTAATTTMNIGQANARRYLGAFETICKQQINCIWTHNYNTIICFCVKKSNNAKIGCHIFAIVLRILRSNAVDLYFDFSDLIFLIGNRIRFYFQYSIRKISSNGIMIYFLHNTKI